jgi:hypothetical protein
MSLAYTHNYSAPLYVSVYTSSMGGYTFTLGLYVELGVTVGLSLEKKAAVCVCGLF